MLVPVDVDGKFTGNTLSLLKPVISYTRFLRCD